MLSQNEVREIMKKDLYSANVRIEELEQALGSVVGTAGHMYQIYFSGAESMKWVSDDINSAKLVLEKSHES